VGQAAVGDMLTSAVAVLSLAALALWKKCPDSLLVALGGVIGLVAYPVLGPDWLLR
jgi:chromate transporter